MQSIDTRLADGSKFKFANMASTIVNTVKGEGVGAIIEINENTTTCFF